MALMVISTTLLLLGIIDKSSGAVCGGKYSSETGTISHPAAQAGTYYKSNELCAWIIKSTVPLYFHFSKFTTENTHDTVFARDGSNVGAPLINKFSGKSVNGSFITSGDAYIQFTSDSTVVGTGFVLHWKIYSAEEQCKEINGFCVRSGVKCDGIISIIHNNCNDKCVCCATLRVSEPLLDGRKTWFHEQLGINQELTVVNLAVHGGVAYPAASHESGNYPAMAAFENGGFWHSPRPYILPQFLWVEFPVPIRIVKYSFTSRTDGRYVATDGPSKHIFWASDCKNETSWVNLFIDDTGVPFESSNNPKIREISNNNFYICYGFEIKGVPGRNDGSKPVTIGNVKLYSKLECSGVSIAGQCLKFSTEKLSWHDARENCLSQNATLASLTNPDIFNFYANLTPDIAGDKFWLGASDSTTEGHFVWLNGQALGGQFPWGEKQPDNGNRYHDENCLMWGYKGAYNDDLCSLNLRFVCELKFVYN